MPSHLCGQDNLVVKADQIVLSNTMGLDQLVFMNVELNGHPARALLDTGASVDVVNSRNRGWLEPAIGTSNAATASGKMKVGRHPACDVRINENELANGEFCASVNLSAAEETLESQLDVVIGCPALSNRQLELNFSDGTALFNRIPTERPSNNIRLEKIRSRLRLPSLQLGENNLEVRSLLLDTGSDGAVSLTEPIFQRLAEANEIKYIREIELTSGKSHFKSTVGRLGRVKFGNHVLSDVRVTIGQASGVGMGFLRRFDSKIDMQNLSASFKPSRFFDIPDSAGLAGFKMKRTNGDFVITKVSKKGAGADAGLLVGDRIISINGATLQPNSFYEIQSHIRGDEGKELAIVLLRQGKRVTVKVTLKYVG